MSLEVKGCGCRFRNNKSEHLCYEHMTEFILKLYNEELIKKKVSEDIKLQDISD